MCPILGVSYDFGAVRSLKPSVFGGDFSGRRVAFHAKVNTERPGPANLEVVPGIGRDLLKILAWNAYLK